MRRPRALASLVAGGALVALAGGSPAEPGPAAGGVRLFEALESSPVAVVATVRAPRALDDEAYTAELLVEVPLVGEAAPGSRLEVAWEERARARPTRFADGDEVLVALEPLPGASIWRQRLPDPAQRRATWTIRFRGDAFVRDPATGAILLIQHFLALPPELRDGNPGVSHLVLLAEEAPGILAVAALERLRAVGPLDRSLDETTAVRLLRVLQRSPRLEALVLELIEAKQLEALRAPLLAQAAPDGSAPAALYEALGRLDGGFSPPLTAALLEREDSAAHRAAGARYAAAVASERLARILRVDPAPDVRAAAVTRLVELGGVSEIDRVLYALGDPDPTVRARATRVVAGLGAAAVPALEGVVDHGSAEAARTAVGALRAAGPEGTRALGRIADTHPDQGVRALARVALGRPVGHRH